jgi:hypothetical protein
MSSGIMFVHDLSIGSTDIRGKTRTCIFNDNKKGRNTDLMITYTHLSS